MSADYAYLVDEEGERKALLLMSKESGLYYRDHEEWIPIDDEDELPFNLSSLEVIDANSSAVAAWDTSHAS